MAAIGALNRMAGFGEECDVGKNTGSGPNSLAHTGRPVPPPPSDPPPPAPTEPVTSDRRELVPETAPATTPQPADTPKDDEVPAGTAESVRGKGKEPAEPAENDTSDVAKVVTETTSSRKGKGKEPAEPVENETSDIANVVTETTRSGKGKGKEPAEPVENDNSSVVGDVAEDENDWMRYPAPSGLSSTPDNLPETVLEILRVSVETVAARVAEAETQRREEEEAQQRALDEEAEVERMKEKGKQKDIDYFPIIIPDVEEERRQKVEELARRRQAAVSDRASLDTSRSTNSAGSKERGHTRGKISRIFNRLGGGDKGESSTSRKRGRGAEAMATSALQDRDAILKQLGVSVPKRAGPKYGESPGGEPEAPQLDVNPQLRQLRIASALLQKNYGSRLSVAGSVRRSKGSVEKKVTEVGVAEEKGKGKARAESHSDESSTTVHEECISCFDEFLPETMVKAPCHSYCRDCFGRLVANALQNEQQWPPKCCLNEIPFRTIYACIETDLRNTFQTRAREWSTPIGERVYCHDPSCSVWLDSKATDTGRRVATCPSRHETCTICRGAAHGETDCPEDREVGRTNALAEAEGWKRCARCRALVEHGEACQHMTCRCGYEFCYVCTRVWRTCGCTMEQLIAVKAEATRRRSAREAREAGEEAALQEALAQIESLELKDALAAVERSLEVERKETLRRRREIADRMGEEERRRARVAETFFSYRETLAALHDRLREDLEQDAKQGAAVLRRERDGEMANLLEAHNTELAGLRERAASRAQELERELGNEFAERMANERALEGEYLARLTAYWSGMKNEEPEIARAVAEFRKVLDTQRGEWVRWRDGEVDAAQQLRGENVEVRAEGLMLRRKAKAAEYDEREREEMKRGRAGLGWLSAVVEERERLTREREGLEADDVLSFEEFDPVEVAIVREMLDNGDEIETLEGVDGAKSLPGSLPAAEAGPSGT